MSYSEITFADRNPIKRWLQRSRLETALDLGRNLKSGVLTVCDFGAGNGELCRLLIRDFSNAKILCFEPAPSLMAEAKELLGGHPGLSFLSETTGIDTGSVDILFCLEVFEHLPVDEMQAALLEIQRILKPEGMAVIGVPVEIGVPAAYKGFFRMARRYGNFDATPRNVLSAVMGSPPDDRPVAEISPGLRFHFEHMGFDFRVFAKKLSEFFLMQKRTYSPVPLFGFLMPEIYFVVKAKR